jgi:chromosome segregation ATPase
MKLSVAMFLIRFEKLVADEGSLETRLDEIHLSSDNRFQNLATQVGDLEESHIDVVRELSAIAAGVESIEEAKLLFEDRYDAVEQKWKSLCEDNAEGWKHLKSHQSGIAVLLKEVIELKDDLNEFKARAEMEIEQNRQAIEEVDSSTSRNLGMFLLCHELSLSVTLFRLSHLS